jgi:hypothetical protein
VSRAVEFHSELPFGASGFILKQISASLGVGREGSKLPGNREFCDDGTVFVSDLAVRFGSTGWTRRGSYGWAGHPHQGASRHLDLAAVRFAVEYGKRSRVRLLFLFVDDPEFTCTTGARTHAIRSRPPRIAAPSASGSNR